MKERASMHEEEAVTLRVEVSRPCRDLWRTLKLLGFSRQEDVFVYLRKEKSIPPWQHDVYIEIDVFHEGKEVFDGDAVWDTVKAVYLLARLPESGMSVFVTKISELAAELHLPLQHYDRIVTPEELVATLRAYAAELKSSIGAPGSEDVAIFIESSYPR